MKGTIFGVLALALAGCGLDEENLGAAQNEAVDEGHQTGGEAGPNATAPSAGTPTPAYQRGTDGVPTTGVEEGHPATAGDAPAATVRPGAGSATTEHSEMLQGTNGVEGTNGAYGADGVQGTNGAYGANGVHGTNGKDYGAKGKDGVEKTGAVPTPDAGTAQNQGTQQGANVDAREATAKALSTLHQSHVHEIALAQLAAEKATAAELKQYANELVQEHTTADASLVALARDEGIALDEASQKQNAEQLATHERLKGLSGAAFDQAYADVMVQEHNNAITMVTESLTTIQDPEVKSYLDGLVPKLQNHLKDLQGIMQKPREEGA